MVTIDAAVKDYSDEDLLRNLSRLADQGRDVTADLIALLVALIGRRALWAGLGYQSPHAFCVGRLLLSDAQAYHRLAAADVARRFPLALTRLRDGRLTLTNVALLRPHLTGENGPRVLAWAEGRSRHEVEVFIRTLAPLPDVTPSLRRLAGSSAGLPPRAAERSPGMIAGAPLPMSELDGRASCREVRGPGSGKGATGDPDCRSDVLSDTLKPGERGLFDGPTANKGAGADGALAGYDTLRASAPAASAASPSSPAARAGVEAMPPASVVQPVVALPHSAILPPRAELRPLAPARYSLRVTISEETRDKLRRAAAFLGNTVGGDYGEVLDRALTLLVQHLERDRFGVRSAMPRKMVGTSDTGLEVTPSSRRRSHPPSKRADNSRPNESPGEEARRAQPSDTHPPTRYIPAVVRRAVFARDGARCSFTGPAGRCTQTRGLQLHHRQPFAEGGPATVDNLQVLCKLHNEHEAVRWFGEDVLGEGRRREPVTRKAATLHSSVDAAIVQAAPEPRAAFDAPQRQRSRPERVLFDQSKSVRPQDGT